MTPHELQNLIAKLESKLARQNQAANATRAEIDNLDKLNRAGTIGDSTEYGNIITALRVKLMRQHNAYVATDGYLKVLRSTTGVKTDKPKA